MRPRISPSQIKSWETCPRRWWYDRNRPRAEHPAAVKGTQVHHVLENYLIWAEPPDLSTDVGQTALAGLAHIPLPHQAAVERSFEFEHGGAVYNGRIDYDHDYQPGRSVRIGDHKTIGQIARRKKPDELVDDPQMIIYSHWAAEHFAVELVIARWVYYQRVTKARGPASEFVELRTTREQARERFERLHQNRALPLIDAKRRDLQPVHLARNTDACELYPPFGCPHKRECFADATAADFLLDV